MEKSDVMHHEQLKLLIISVFHTLEQNDLLNEVDENTIEFVENLIHHNDNLNAVDLLDTIEILKTEIQKTEV
mgnify:CR=1 FL=1